MKKFQFAISGGPWHGWPYLIYSQRTFLIIFTFLLFVLLVVNVSLNQTFLIFSFHLIQTWETLSTPVIFLGLYSFNLTGFCYSYEWSFSSGEEESSFPCHLSFENSDDSSLCFRLAYLIQCLTSYFFSITHCSLLCA